MHVSISNPTVAIMTPWPLVRLGIERLIKELVPQASFNVAVTSMDQLQAAMYAHPASLVILEFNSYQQELGPSVQQLRWLCQAYPRLCIVVYSCYLNSTTLTALWQLSQVSLLLGQVPISQLREEMTQVIAGKRVWNSSRVVTPPAEPALQCSSFALLTRSELQVLRLLQEGSSVTNIAAKCHRSIKTISAHKCNIMRKLGLHSAVELFGLPKVRMEGSGSSEFIQTPLQPIPRGP